MTMLIATEITVDPCGFRTMPIVTADILTNLTMPAEAPITHTILNSSTCCKTINSLDHPLCK